jgi:tetratricopeptide (TPR) repeat protein
LKTTQNPIQRIRIRFKFVFILLLCFSPLILCADDLSKAQDLEREGRFDDAREYYVRWLHDSKNSGTASFGRILVHTLRISGSLKDDLLLVEDSLNKVLLKEDKLVLIETALVLAELTSDQEKKKKYLDLLLEAQDDLPGRDSPALTRLVFQDEVLSLRDLGLGTSLSDLQKKNQYVMALRNLEDEQILIWLDKVHNEFPALLNEPDWLYLVQQKLAQGGKEDQAQNYRQILIDEFPQSIERALLKKQHISLLPNPQSLLKDLSVFETVPVVDAEVQKVLVQVGAFQDYDNALQMKREIESRGEQCRIERDGNVHKVIIISTNISETERVLESLGIKWFRIPRIP